MAVSTEFSQFERDCDAEKILAIVESVDRLVSLDVESAIVGMRIVKPQSRARTDTQFHASAKAGAGFPIFFADLDVAGGKLGVKFGPDDTNATVKQRCIADLITQPCTASI